ncbi:YfhO family protein [Paramagnetospirillum kuznetsovii]|nr:YfhO family protein [Paramagnetospirillum kuznetsovii]
MHLPALETIGQAWSPLIRGGADLAQTGSASLISQILFGGIPIRFSYPVLITASLIGGTWCMYRLIRNQMAEPMPATLAAMAYGACATSVFLVNINLALLPVVLLAISRYLDAKYSVLRGLVALASALVTVGVPFPSDVLQYFSLALVLWFAVVERRTSRTDWIIIFLFCAIPLIRINEAFSLSAHLNESAFYYTRGMKHYTATTVLTEIIGTLSSFHVEFLLIHLGLPVGVFLIRRNSAAYILLPTAAVLALLFSRTFVSSYDGPLSALVLSFSYVKIMGYMILPELAVTMAIGIRYLSRSLPAIGGGAMTVAIIAAMTVSTGVQKYRNLTLDWLSNGNYVRNFESPVLRALAQRVAQDPWPSRVEPIFLYPAHLNAYGLETESGDMPAGPRRHFEFWSAIMEPWIAQEGGPEAVSPDMKDLLERDGGWPQFRSERPNLVTSGTRTAESYAVRPMDRLYRMNLLSLANVRYFVSREPLSGPGLVEVERAPKPWGGLSLREKVMVSLTENLSGRQWLYVYRNDLALPRFFTVGNIRAFDNDRATVEAMAQAPVEILRETLFARRDELPPGLAVDATPTPGKITPRVYSSDRIELDISVDGRQVLVVTNTFSRYWKASVDDVPTALFPADHTFWGIALEKGNHRVVFTYVPSYLPWVQAVSHAGNSLLSP